MKILRLAAENFKRLRAVEIVPDGNVVRITGRNGAGKSSALDAIWAALGGERVSPPVPIRQGEERAEVNIDLGEILVRRRWTTSGSSIEVSNGKATFKSPQKLLDELVGKLCFDPLAFANAKPADQRASLLGLLGIEDRLAVVEAERKDAFDQRTQVNRDLKALEGQLAGTPHVEAPAEEVSVAALMEELRSARGQQEERAALMAVADRHDAKSTQLANNSSAAILEAEDLEKQAKDLRAEAAEFTRSSQAFAAEAGEVRKKAMEVLVPDVASVEARIAGAEGTNQKVRQAKARLDLQRRVNATRKSSESLSEAVAAAERKKTELVATSPLPVVGLGFSEAGVTFNGVPLEQCSASERLKVSVAVAMALNPRLKVILVRDASLLDSANLRVLEELAKARDFQVWVEQVEESGKVGVFIEDGAVSAVDGIPAPQPAPEAKAG